MPGPQPAGGPPPGEPRGGGLRRALGQLALWAGPAGLGLALAVLLAGAASGHFRSGPGVPTAGDSRAWAAMWGALGLVAAGTLVGVLANAIWLAKTLTESRRPRVADWVRICVHATMGGLLWWALRAS